MKFQETKINGKTAYVISKANMEAIRAETLLNSLKAKAARPDAYRELRQTLQEALSSKILIDEYYPLAKKISVFLKELIEVASGTIFYQAYKDINPDIYGTAQGFTQQLKDLLKDMEEIDK